MKRNRFAPTVMGIVSLLFLFSLSAATGSRGAPGPLLTAVPDSTLGEIKGTLIAKSSKRPLGVVPELLRDKVEGEDDEEIQRLMDQMETVPDSTCGFHWVNVPPGHYHLFTYEIGLIRPGFDVAAGEVVDLGEIEVEPNRERPRQRMDP